MSAPVLEYVAGNQAGVHLSVTKRTREIFLNGRETMDP
jgi:hypothetical protein